MARRRRSKDELTVVCWLYPGPRNYRPAFVNVLYRQVQEHLPMKHRFVCIYDDRSYGLADFSDGIELMPIPESIRHLLSLGSLGGAMHPACFTRLWHMSADAAETFPGRVFMFDVDSIPIGDMSSLVRYREDADFISMLRIPRRTRAYITGGSWILRAGAFTQIWDDFIVDPVQARADAAQWFLNGHEQRAIGWTGGSDQAYLSYRLVPLMSDDGPVTFWPDDCGILLWDHFRKQKGNAEGCLLHFNGVHKPWSLDWPITRRIYGDPEYRVSDRPLKYGGKLYEIGARFIGPRQDAVALMAMGRIEAA